MEQEGRSFIMLRYAGVCKVCSYNGVSAVFCFCINWSHENTTGCMTLKLD